ncbi:serine phosphatase [Desulfovibrio sp. X2]|uniref:SpoIIE family protein phosphatase n=1 Tax=Desulfovibrio sp. X2 TaxID=941449 RepID=UPI000358E60D|nr:SpoIIE family protein phosphatase [Desulfovibrio sp. X2]EPR44536.1 serine phosphatase [Desulfovibrio sp. X2]
MPTAAEHRHGPGLAIRLAGLVLAATGVIFAVAFGYNYQKSRALLLKNVRISAQSLTRATVSKLEETLHGLQSVPLAAAAGLSNGSLDVPAAQAMMKDFLESAPEAYGGGLFLDPGASGDGRSRASAYFCRKNGSVARTPLGADYDYSLMDWYMLPKYLGSPQWSEPFYDESGGDTLMATFAVPVRRGPAGARSFAGVVTVDLALDELQRAVAALHPDISGYAFLISRNGRIVSHPERRLIMRESIFSLAEAMHDQALRDVGKDMVRGGQGFARLGGAALGKPVWIYYAPLPGVGWSLGLVIPEKDLFADLYKLHRDVVVIGVCGFTALLGFVILIAATITRPIRNLARTSAEIARGNLDVDLPVVRRGDEVGELTRSFDEMRLALKEYIANLTETTKAKERMESELKIARNIQMSFLPKRFPPFPEIEAFELHALLTPAYEVGGDLYDFFLLDENRLFILVGDVSGKGVPAALFMAVSKTLVKGIAEQDSDPGLILAKVNDELAEDNDAMLFVTMFCAVLDFRTGELVYANAGHNYPVLVRADGRTSFVELPPGTAMGVIPGLAYPSERLFLDRGDVLVAYTDGVNEAQDARGALFGNERLLETVHRTGPAEPRRLCTVLLDEVRAFAHGADQADDITVLALAYKGPRREG